MFKPCYVLKICSKMSDLFKIINKSIIMLYHHEILHVIFLSTYFLSACTGFIFMFGTGLADTLELIGCRPH